MEKVLIEKVNSSLKHEQEKKKFKISDKKYEKCETKSKNHNIFIYILMYQDN